MKVIDLTHVINTEMPVYPGTEPPGFEPANTYERDGFKISAADGNPLMTVKRIVHFGIILV